MPTPRPTPTPTPIPRPTAPTPITPPPPIITTSAAPKVGVSQIDAGKQAITELTKMGVSTDIGTIRSNWAKYGLDRKLGAWVGSTVQWNAYSKHTQDELARIQVGIEGVRAGVERIRAGIEQLKVGETITPTGEIETTPPPDIVLPRENLPSIISDISTGVIAIPEIEIAKEAAKFRKESEKRRATQALEQTQQLLASRGMTFSGIRTEAEANLAAEHFANLTGISLDLASRVINAARQEEQRRQPTIREFNNALYSIYPDGRTVKLLEGTAELEKATIGGRLYERNPATGDWEIKIDDPSLDIVSDMVGSAETGYSLITYNKRTGQVLRESIVSGAVSVGLTPNAGHQALADRYLSDPRFDFTDIPRDEMAGVSLALQERVKTLDIEDKTVEAITDKLIAAQKMGKRLTLTDNELRLMITDDYEADKSYGKVIEAIGGFSITSNTKLRARAIADEIYYPPAPPRRIREMPLFFDIFFPSIFRHPS